MPPIVSTIDVARPPDEVYAYATDPSRFAAWQHDVEDVRIHGDGPLAVGSRFTTTRRVGRVEYKTTQEVTEDDPPGRWAARSVEGPLIAIATITVAPLAGGTRSRVTFTLDFQGRGMGRILVPDVVRGLAQRTAPRSYQNFKEQLERDAWSPPDSDAGPRRASRPTDRATG